MGIFGDGQRGRAAAKGYNFAAHEYLQELCDRCHAAWAKVEVITSAGSVFFCQHHHKQYRHSVIAAGHQIRAVLGLYGASGAWGLKPQRLQHRGHRQSHDVGELIRNPDQPTGQDGDAHDFPAGRRRQQSQEILPGVPGRVGDLDAGGHDGTSDSVSTRPRLGRSASMVRFSARISAAK